MVSRDFCGDNCFDRIAIPVDKPSVHDGYG